MTTFPKSSIGLINYDIEEILTYINITVNYNRRGGDLSPIMYTKYALK